MHDLGPQARQVYDALRERIASGTYAPGSCLPPHKETARAFGVALMTARQALERLEDEGLIVSLQGRGTFVRLRVPESVLVVDPDRVGRGAACAQVMDSGYRPVHAENPAEAVRRLCTDPSIVLVLTEVRLPSLEDGLWFMRTVHDRWPTVPLGALTGSMQDLVSLRDTPECPVLILSKPICPDRLREVLRLTMHPSSRRATDAEQLPGGPPSESSPPWHR